MFRLDLVFLHYPKPSSLNIERFHKRPFYPTRVEQLVFSTQNIYLNWLAKDQGKKSRYVLKKVP
jgi:hypothetical protein